jgi:hypothetical protein
MSAAPPKFSSRRRIVPAERGRNNSHRVHRTMVSRCRGIVGNSSLHAFFNEQVPALCVEACGGLLAKQRGLFGFSCRTGSAYAWTASSSRRWRYGLSSGLRLAGNTSAPLPVGASICSSFSLLSTCVFYLCRYLQGTASAVSLLRQRSLLLAYYRLLSRTIGPRCVLLGPLHPRIS